MVGPQAHQHHEINTQRRELQETLRGCGELCRGRLIFLVGLPRSGKSTYAHSWAIERPGRAIISGDSFRKALHGHAYIPEAEATVYSMMDVAAKSLLSEGIDVVIDETCTTEMTLMRYYRIDLEAEPVFINTPADECRKRAIDSHKTYLIPVIDRLQKQHEYLVKNWTEISFRCKEQVAYRQKFDYTK